MKSFFGGLLEGKLYAPHIAVDISASFCYSSLLSHRLFLPAAVVEGYFVS